ncbi:MAG: MerC domain-containing protein [Candidatus Binatia bacterium]|nr:MerC domain-containing protein [Candidatus Binatia bacterium]
MRYALSRVEGMGIWTATACALHCLTASFLLAALPLAGLGFSLAEAVEAFLLLSSFLIAGYTSCVGIRIHGRRWLLLIPLAAATLVASGWGSAAARSERICAASGAILLAAGQVFNRYLCRTCCDRVEQ